MEQLGSLWADFHEIWYLLVFRNSVKKFKFHWNITRMPDALHEGQYTLLIISRSVLKIGNVADKTCTENKYTHFMGNNFFSRKCCTLWDNVDKHCRAAGHRLQYGACAFYAGYQSLQTHTLSIQYVLFFHCNNGYRNAPHCYVILTLFALFIHTLAFWVMRLCNVAGSNISEVYTASIFRVVLVHIFQTTWCHNSLRPQYKSAL